MPNTSIAEVRNLWRGKTITINEEMIVSGYVSSSDEAGNFYQTFTICDGDSAAEIMAGVRDLHNSYPLGSYICVKLKGCAVGVERGVLQIGLMPASYSNYAVDYFYSRVVMERFIERGIGLSDVEARTLDFEGLDESLCGMLVRIEGLRLVEECEPTETEDEVPLLPAIWAGYRPFVDSDGNRIFVYTSNYATYAENEVPTTLCNITGILQYGSVAGESDEVFILKMRAKNDCVALDSGSM